MSKDVMLLNVMNSFYDSYNLYCHFVIDFYVMIILFIQVGHFSILVYASVLFYSYWYVVDANIINAVPFLDGYSIAHLTNHCYCILAYAATRYTYAMMISQSMQLP